MNASKLLDAFKEKFGMKTDADVAYVFDVHPQQITDWRSGHREIPLLIALRLADHLGYAWVRDAILFGLVPEEEHQVFKAHDNDRMRERAELHHAKKKKNKNVDKKAN
jgi:hypothetical protein